MEYSNRLEHYDELEHKRNGFKWSINEILRLQREYELLELDIFEIATLHERSPKAIMYKLHEEGFDTFENLYEKYGSTKKKTRHNKKC
jgi:hypothetical protein